MEQQIYDKDKTKEFFKHLVKAYQRYEKKDKAKERLDIHIEKVELLSSDKKTSKKKLEQGFERLRKQIVDVIALEKGMLNKGDNVSEEVKERITELEKKLSKYTSLIEGRKQRMKKLDQRIKDKIKLDKDITDNSETIKLRNLLFDLEEKYYDLKEKGVPASKLKVIEDKIKKIKQKI